MNKDAHAYVGVHCVCTRARGTYLFPVYAIYISGRTPIIPHRIVTSAIQWTFQPIAGDELVHKGYLLSTLNFRPSHISWHIMNVQRHEVKCPVQIGFGFGWRDKPKWLSPGWYELNIKLARRYIILPRWDVLGYCSLDQLPLFLVLEI